MFTVQMGEITRNLLYVYRVQSNPLAVISAPREVSYTSRTEKVGRSNYIFKRLLLFVVAVSIRYKIRSAATSCDKVRLGLNLKSQSDLQDS